MLKSVLECCKNVKKKLKTMEKMEKNGKTEKSWKKFFKKSSWKKPSKSQIRPRRTKVWPTPIKLCNRDP